MDFLMDNLAGLVLGLAVFLLIAGLALSAAVSLHNKLMGGEPGSPSRLRAPSLTSAMGIAFAVHLFSAIVNYPISLVEPASLRWQLLGIPIGYVCTTLVLKAALRASFKQALFVALLYLVMLSVVLAAAFAGLFIYSTGAF